MKIYEKILLNDLFFNLKRFKEWKKVGYLYQDMISFYEGCIYTDLLLYTNYVFLHNDNYELLHRVQDLYNKIKGR